MYAIHPHIGKTACIQVAAFVKACDRVYPSCDWTKLCVRFGKAAFEVEKLLVEEGIFSEFCDGNVITFYLSPATKITDFSALIQRLQELFLKFPLEQEETVVVEEAADTGCENVEKEWLAFAEAEGRICAENCGLFPPCTPLLTVGQLITKEKLRLLENAENLFGLRDGKILVMKQQTKE